MNCAVIFNTKVNSYHNALTAHIMHTAGILLLLSFYAQYTAWRILTEQSLTATHPCWQQLAHLDYEKDARVLLHSVTYTICTPSTDHLFTTFFWPFCSLKLTNNGTDTYCQNAACMFNVHSQWLKQNNSIKDLEQLQILTNFMAKILHRDLSSVSTHSTLLQCHDRLHTGQVYGNWSDWQGW